MNSQAAGASEGFRTPESMSDAMSAALARNWWAVALRGVLGIVVVLTWWFGTYALVFGIALLVVAFRLRARHNHLAHATVARSTI